MLESDISFTIDVPGVGTIPQPMNSAGFFNLQIINDASVSRENLKHLHLAIEQAIKIDEAFNF